MSRSVNNVHLLGNVGRDPDVRQTKAGGKVAHFSLATNRKHGDGERTDWHRITLWNRQAQFAEDYIRTGDKVYVEGRIEYDSYERDGVTIPTAEVVAHEVVLLTPKPATADDDSDLPFV